MRKGKENGFVALKDRCTHLFPLEGEGEVLDEGDGVCFRHDGMLYLGDVVFFLGAKFYVMLFFGYNDLLKLN